MAFFSRSRVAPVVVMLVISLAVVLSPAAAEETCSIRGSVLDPGGGSVGFATISLIRPARAVLSDGEGRFCIPGLEPGRYEVLVRAPGFGDLSVTVAVPEAGTAGPTVVRLEPSLLTTVVVTATRTDRALADVPIRVEVMNRDEIERSQARTLADAAEYNSGVYVESNCQNCNFQQVRLLGLDGAYSQILVDGLPVFSSLGAVYGVEQIPARMIQQLEIVKGGGSALYGPGAVGGVINVIPREPVANSGGIKMEFTGDDYGSPRSRPESVQGSLDLLSASGRTSLTAFGQTDTVDAVDVDGDGYTEVGRRELDAVGFRLTQATGAEGNGKLTLDVGRVTEDRRGGNKLDLPPDQADVAEAVVSERTNVALTWRHRAGRAFDYALTAAYAATDRDTYYGSGMDPNAYGFTGNPLLILDAQLNRRTGSHRFTWGVQHSRDHLEDAQPSYGRFTDETYVNSGLYFQDDWTLAGGWNLLWGARLDDHSEVDRPVLSPRVAVKYAPSRALNLRGSIAAGFRAPQVFDEDLHITQVGGQGAVIRNAPDLREESSWSTMVGLEWMPRIGRRFARLEANAFHTDIHDLFLVEEDDDPQTGDQFEFTRINSGGATVHGLEVNGDFSVTSRVTVSAGVVVQRSRFDRPEENFGSTRFFRTPDTYGLLALDWDIPRFAELFVAARYAGSMLVPHYIFDPVTGDEIEAVLEKAPSFLTWDVNLGREIPVRGRGSIRVALGVKNLTDAYQRDLDQGQFRDAGYVYGPRFPRRYFLALGYDF